MPRFIVEPTYRVIDTQRLNIDCGVVEDGFDTLTAAQEHAADLEDLFRDDDGMHLYDITVTAAVRAASLDDALGRVDSALEEARNADSEASDSDIAVIEEWRFDESSSIVGN
jgi:hypothetical protein